MSQRRATIVSVLAGLLLTATGLIVVAYAMQGPTWQVTKAEGPQVQGLNLSPIAGVRGNGDIPQLCTSDNEKGELKSFSYTAPASNSSWNQQAKCSGQAGAGQIIIVRAVDAVSPDIADVCTKAKRITNMDLDAVQPGSVTPVLRYHLQNALVTSIALRAPNAPGRTKGEEVPLKQPDEEITINYGAISWHYVPAASSGKSKSSSTPNATQ